MRTCTCGSTTRSGSSSTGPRTVLALMIRTSSGEGVAVVEARRETAVDDDVAPGGRPGAFGQQQVDDARGDVLRTQQAADRVAACGVLEHGVAVGQRGEVPLEHRGEGRAGAHGVDADPVRGELDGE